MKQQTPHIYFGAHRRRTRDRWALGAGHPVYGRPDLAKPVSPRGRPAGRKPQNPDFRDESGRLLPMHIVLASLHCGLLRDLTAFLAIIAFLAAVTIGADFWVNG